MERNINDPIPNNPIGSHFATTQFDLYHRTRHFIEGGQSGLPIGYGVSTEFDLGEHFDYTTQYNQPKESRKCASAPVLVVAISSPDPRLIPPKSFQVQCFLQSREPWQGLREFLWLFLFFKGASEGVRFSLSPVICPVGVFIMTADPPLAQIIQKFLTRFLMIGFVPKVYGFFRVVVQVKKLSLFFIKK